MIDQADTLHTIAQVAMTLIGFSGIVIAIGDRAVSKWTPEEWLRFFSLIQPTLTAFFCSFAPILVAYLVADTDTIWRVSNAILGVAHSMGVAAFFANPKKAKITPGQRVNGAIGLLVFVFIFGLLQQTWIGIYNFLLLLKPRESGAS